ncbi:uncharacterized protein Bfra_008483 [Botrytis fragariae]|uniref:Uncharacterized protein n=1 Tax=Botrytis fragariae TaxID=1964551 RepID=A0A8H6AT78_9HELO|nr:uncharacterized protein Bfra_008483 [Botrytis fragariae]KAF5873204.1 hypothetical protein Bfra_008483 [Botrytis fragariae]
MGIVAGRKDFQPENLDASTWPAYEGTINPNKHAPASVCTPQMESEDLNQAYFSFTYIRDRIPPLPPIPDTTQVRQQEINRLIIQSEMNSSTPRSGWSVHGPQNAWGNLGASGDPNDSRTSDAWQDSSTRTARIQDLKTQRWTSTADDQAYASDRNLAAHRGDQTETNINTSSYPHSDLPLPHPNLNLDFRMSVSLNPRISIGQTPFGHRNWISFTGGVWSGSWGSGIPGGQDSQLIIPDGSARLETNYLLQTHDDPPAHIAIKTHGWRTGPTEVLAQLADPALADQVDPNSYKFRLFIEMETGDERYCSKVNCGMWVGSGMRKGAEVIYERGSSDGENAGPGVLLLPLTSSRS